MTPPWILDACAAVMLAVAAVSAVRLAAQSCQHRWVVPGADIAQLLMAIAMAGMLASSLVTLSDFAWTVVFGLLTAWFACRVTWDARASGARALAVGHYTQHLVHSAAMFSVFLTLVAPSAGGSPGMSGMSRSLGQAMPAPGNPTLAFAFGLVLIGYCVWDLDQLSAARHAFAGRRARLPGRVPSSASALVVAHGQPTQLTGAAPALRRTAAQAAPDQEGGWTAGPAAFLLSPGMTASCRIAMGVIMVLMLFLMI